MRPPWLLDELTHAGPEHLDPAFVDNFDRKQGFPDPTPDLDILAGLGVGPTATVVDLGAGTGQFTFAAASLHRHVVAVDVSSVMVEQLRRRAHEARSANVEVVQAGFLDYEHTGSPADAVHTRHALHQLPDFWKALALQRIAGMLRPGGVLRLRDLIYDFGPAEAPELFAQWLANAGTDAAIGYTADDYAEHIRTEHSTFRWLFEPMLDAAGFDVVDVEFTGAFFGAYTCRRR